MNEENAEVNENTDTPSQLTLLKERADIMGIKYHPKIGVDALSTKISDHIKSCEESSQNDDKDESLGLIIPAVAKVSGRQIQIKRATKLHRIRITCMNDKKSKLQGELFSAGNSAIGFIKKFVPFNAEHGWHVPYILLKKIENAKYVVHYEVVINGKKVNKHKLVPEFSVEYLKPLTEKELIDLRQRQLINDKE